MTKADLIEMVASRSNLPKKHAELIVHTIFRCMSLMPMGSSLFDFHDFVIDNNQHPENATFPVQATGPGPGSRCSRNPA